MPSRTLAKNSAERIKILEPRLARIEVKLAAMVARRDALLAELMHERAGLALYSPPEPAATPGLPPPNTGSFEFGDPPEWDRSYAALRRLQGRGDPEETHDPVADQYKIDHLDPPDFEELSRKFAEREGVPVIIVQK